MHRFVVGLMALSLAAVTPGAVSAQGWHVGLEGGVNVSDLDIEGEDTDSETGFRIGGVLRYDFAPSGLIGLQTGAAYSQKGASQTEGGVEATIELDYVEVPLLLAVNVPTGSAVRPRFYAGPQLAFEASCSLSGADGSVSIDVDCDASELQEIGFETESTDFSLLFGGGLELGAGPGAVTLDVRYDLGLTDINASEGPDQAEAKNRNLQLSAGYLISLP